MLPAERRREMARLIKNRGAVNTRELAEALGISTMTVRRDLKVLEERNQLELTWGGAVPLAFVVGPGKRNHCHVRFGAPVDDAVEVLVTLAIVAIEHL